MNQQAKRIFDQVADAHQRMRTDVGSAKPFMATARLKLERVVEQAQRAKSPELADYATSAVNFLTSMSRQERYTSAFVGGLDALERAAGQVPEFKKDSNLENLLTLRRTDPERYERLSEAERDAAESYEALKKA